MIDLFHVVLRLNLEILRIHFDGLDFHFDISSCSEKFVYPMFLFVYV